MTLDELIDALTELRAGELRGDGSLQVEHCGPGGGIVQVVIEGDARHPRGCVVLYDAVSITEERM